MGNFDNLTKRISSIRRNDLFGNSVKNLFIQIAGLGLSYVGVYLITRTYDADVLGYYTLANVFLQLSTMVVLFGINTATVQMVPGLILKNEKQAISSILLKGILHVLIVGFAITVILYFSSGAIAIYFMHKPRLTAAYQITSLAIVPFAILTFLADFLRGFGKNILWAIITRILVFLTFIVFFVVVLVTIKNPEPISLNTFANFTALIITLIIFFVFCRRQSLNIHLKDIKHAPSYAELRRLSFPMFLFSSTLLLSSWITTIMVGSLGTTADTGIYRVVDRVASLSILILTAVNAVLAPKIAACFSMNDIKLLKKNVFFATKLVFWLGLPIQIMLIYFHNSVLSIFGHEFVQGKGALIIILLGQIINSISGPCGQVLNMTSHQVFLRNVSLFGLILMIVINYFLIPPYGIVGAAISALVGNVYINIMCVIKIKKEFSFNLIYNPLDIFRAK